MLPLVLGGMAVLNAINQDNANKRQNDLAQKASNIINSVPLPVLKEYYPDLYQQIGELAPEMLQAKELEDTQMSSIALDPALRQAQMNALRQIQDIGEQGGMTATDRARLAQIENEQASALKGQTGAIMQNMATRGLSGGMSEMVARQIAAQEGANRAAQQGLDVKAQAEQRALQALMQSGQLGGQMEQQQFNQAAQVAQAKDAIARFNAENLQNVAQQNVQARNQAQAQNVQAAQNIANQNVGLRNQAQTYNLGLPQQQYQNQMARATGQASGIQNQASLLAQQQAAQNQMIGGLLQTGAQYYAGKK